jgi:hypothetical protein
MVIPVEDPTSKASVLWPPWVSPSLLLIVRPLNWVLVAPLIEKIWTGEFLMVCRLVSGRCKSWSFVCVTYETLDDRVGHGVGVEELGLSLAAVGTLGVPPTSSIAIESSTSTVDGERVTRDGNKRARPLLVAEGGSALEHDVCSLSELGQVESRASRNNKAVQSDGRAG